MEFTEKHLASLKRMGEVIEPILEEGIEYYAIQTTTRYGASGGSIFKMTDGKRDYLDRKSYRDTLEEKIDFFSITSSFPSFTKIKYTLKKGEPIQAQVFDGPMLLEEIMQEYKDVVSDPGGNKRIEETTVFERGSEIKFDSRITFYRPDGSIDNYDRDSARAGDEFKCLDKLLGGTLQKVRIECEADYFSIATLPAIPELGIPEYFVEVDTSDFDPKDKEKVFEYMESGEPEKVQVVLEALKTEKGLRKRLNARYLNFVKARLGDDAEMEQYAEAMPKGSQIRKVLEDQKLDDDYISFHYMDGEECLMMVDLLGSLVKNVINIQDFKSEAMLTKKQDDLGPIYESYAKKVRRYLKREAKVHPKGWFARLCDIMKDLSVNRILYDHTSYDEANTSSVKEEYMFMTYLNSYKYSMDIFQSDEPDLTDIFWMLPQIPTTYWGDTTPDFPENPLSYKRNAKYCVDHRWKTLKR